MAGPLIHALDCNATIGIPSMNAPRQNITCIGQVLSLHADVTSDEMVAIDCIAKTGSAAPVISQVCADISDNAISGAVCVVT